MKSFMAQLFDCYENSEPDGVQVTVIKVTPHTTKMVVNWTGSDKKWTFYMPKDLVNKNTLAAFAYHCYWVIMAEKEEKGMI